MTLSQKHRIGSSYCVRNSIIYLLSRRTLYVLTQVLFWWLFPKLPHKMEIRFALQWRHNGRDSVSNHQPHDCLLNRLFRRRSKKASKLRVSGLCAGISPGPVNCPHKGQLRGKCFHLMTSSWTHRRSVMLSADNFFPGSLMKWDLLAVRYCLYVNKSVTMMLTSGTDIWCKSCYQNCFAFYVMMDFSQLNRSNSTGD